MNTANDYGGDLCKSHSARSEKEFCRVCPSNLNKKELENVYFTLLENNLDLKTTINSQRERIKILSTKVQRLTALQKTYLGKDPKECHGSNTVINEQKECILDLRRSNQCLSERVRQLNMRLCSAKQFLKRSPFQSTSRCNRCSNKNASMSALITKRSETNLKTTAASSQYLVKDVMSSRTAENVITSHEKGVQYDFCDENKCRNHIEELKRKNYDLQEELSRVKENQAAVTTQLERDVRDLRAENLRVRSDRTYAEDRSEHLQVQLAEATAKLGGADLRCDELSVQLAVEQRKVSELETRLQAADMSRRIADAIETHLTNVKMAKDHINVFRDVETSVQEKATNDTNKFLAVHSPIYQPKAAVRTKLPHRVQVDEAFKSSDDSGYTEVNKSQEVDDTKASSYVNQVLLEKIADLQNQVNKLKAFKNNYDKPNESFNMTQTFNSAPPQMFTILPDKEQIDENAISESSDSVITEKKVNANIILTQQTKHEKNENIEFTAKANQGNSSSELNPKNEGNKIEKQQDNIISDIKARESFKRFKRRSKDINREPNVASRKLSLHNPKDFLKEKNLIKTGSLDENRVINEDSVKIGSMNRFEVRNIVTRVSTKKQISKAVADTDLLSFPDNNIPYIEKDIVKSSDIEADVQSKIIVKNAENNTNSCTHEDKRKDSDSSKGTYSIHKDENLSKLNTEHKDAIINITEGNRIIKYNTTYKDPYTLAVGHKKILHSVTPKDKFIHRRKSLASEPRTYIKVPRDVSPDSTECEISSLSDLPSERDDRASLSRSPGEERRTASESRGDTTTATTDYGSLSEGELPHLRDTTILSDGEKRLSNKMGKSHSMPASGAQQMEAALAAVQQELARCSRLLANRGHHSLDIPGVNWQQVTNTGL